MEKMSNAFIEMDALAEQAGGYFALLLSFASKQRLALLCELCFNLMR